jgi:hypothetical protein
MHTKSSTDCPWDHPLPEGECNFTLCQVFFRSDDDSLALTGDCRRGVTGGLPKRSREWVRLP